MSSELNFSEKPKGSLYQNLAAAFMIVIGYVYAERFVKERTYFNMILGFCMYVAGWSYFLYNDHLNESETVLQEGTGKWWIGIIIPVIAIFGHLMYIYGTKQSLLSILVIVAYIAAWITYLTYKSFNRENQEEAFTVNFVGLGILFMGMLYHLAMDPNRFNLGFRYSFFRDTIYNPMFVLVSFGFSLLAVGNSLK